MIVKEVVAVMESTRLCGTNAVGSRTVNYMVVGRSENLKVQVTTIKFQVKNKVPIKVKERKFLKFIT